MSTTRAVPLTCHGHSRPITYLNFSPIVEDGKFYLLSACKDNNPILRSGQTGDWIGTFLGHKGAVWSARLSHDARFAATGSADYTAKVWNAATGEVVAELQHEHIVRTVEFVPNGADMSLCIRAAAGAGLGEMEGTGALLTGGADKKLRLWRFSTTEAARVSGTTSPAPDAGSSIQQQQPTQIEFAPGTHTGTIKSIIFTSDNPNFFITASDDGSPNSGRLRWFDLRRPNEVIAELAIEGGFGSCEMNVRPSSSSSHTTSTTVNGTHDTNATNGISLSNTHTPPALQSESSILSIASGTNIYFLSGSSSRPANMIRRITNLARDASTVALDLDEGRFVVGGRNDTYVYVYEWDGAASSSDSGSLPNGTQASSLPNLTADEAITAHENGRVVDGCTLRELEVHKGHHGPVWCTAFSPDGRLYATGSEDGTVKLWKYGPGGYGLWRGE